MKKSNIIILWRSFLFVLMFLTQLRQQIATCLDANFSLTCFSRLKYLSNQSNIIAMIWMGLFLYWRNDPQKLSKLVGKIRGAISIYLTIVWLAYWVLLSSSDTATGWDLVTNIVIHYFYPIAFILDWIFFERVQYEWRYYPSWAIYPLLYAGFALVNGSLGWDLGYIYNFLDPEEVGSIGVVFMIMGIYVFFSILSVLFIGCNRKWLSKNNLNQGINQNEDTTEND